RARVGAPDFSERGQRQVVSISRERNPITVRLVSGMGITRREPQVASRRPLRSARLARRGKNERMMVRTRVATSLVAGCLSLLAACSEETATEPRPAPEALDGAAPGSDVAPRDAGDAESP